MREAMPISGLTAAPVTQRDAVAESNHRIANNLALLAGMVRMYARTLSRSEEPLDNDKIGALFDDIGCRIDAIAHLHALLARGEHDEPVDLAAYLRDVATTIMSSMSYAGRAELTTLPSSVCAIAPERAVTVGLIVGELVTNALKYAHPAGVRGLIVVGCKQIGETILIEVTDDGVGMPEDFDPRNNGGLGMRLAHSLADQVKATLAFNNTGIGLSVTLHIPA
ncbi:MAG TPA: sensor histidine kinase [Pseudolabrys sp.]|nr:sensor histidine kinase [Pseudolabrys sp.]